MRPPTAGQRGKYRLSTHTREPGIGKALVAAESTRGELGVQILFNNSAGVASGGRLGASVDEGIAHSLWSALGGDQSLRER